MNANQPFPNQGPNNLMHNLKPNFNRANVPPMHHQQFGHHQSANQPPGSHIQQQRGGFNSFYPHQQPQQNFGSGPAFKNPNLPPNQIPGMIGMPNSAQPAGSFGLANNENKVIY